MSALDCVECAPTPKVPATSTAFVEPILDMTTFVPPNLNQDTPGEELPRVVIEFCDRCRWLHRATWTLTELFLTFPPTTTTSPTGESTFTGLKAITLLPRSDPETGGRFRVWLYRHRTIEDEFEQSEGKESWAGAELVWDRKVEGAFPEMKVLKQRIRNLIAPTRDLGHSDKDAFGKDKVEVPAAGEVASAAGPEGEPTVDDYAPRFRC